MSIQMCIHGRTRQTFSSLFWRILSFIWASNHLRAHSLRSIRYTDGLRLHLALLYLLLRFRPIIEMRPGYQACSTLFALALGLDLCVMNGLWWIPFGYATYGEQGLPTWPTTVVGIWSILGAGFMARVYTLQLRRSESLTLSLHHAISTPTYSCSAPRICCLTP
jgi:hypothetical protein